MSNNKYPGRPQYYDDDYCGAQNTKECLKRLADILLTLGSRATEECLKEIRDGADIEDVAYRYGRILPLASFIKFHDRPLHIGGVSC